MQVSGVKHLNANYNTHYQAIDGCCTTDIFLN